MHILAFWEGYGPGWNAEMPCISMLLPGVSGGNTLDPRLSYFSEKNLRKQHFEVTTCHGGLLGYRQS